MAPARASIDAVERALARQAGLLHTCAFTSEAVRGILARRGESRAVRGAGAGERRRAPGYGVFFVQPTHMPYGGEYEKLRAEVNAVRPRFEKLCLGVPRWRAAQRCAALAKVLAETYPRRRGEAGV